jgi:hypothetical protein
VYLMSGDHDHNFNIDDALRFFTGSHPTGPLRDNPLSWISAVMADHDRGDLRALDESRRQLRRLGWSLEKLSPAPGQTASPA